eukprot:jgi/Astpho2/8948/gw1.00133.212.1_t
MSSPIWELKVIATKVPLNKRRFQGIVEEQDEFTPAQLLEMLAEQNMQVGLVIDLTNTDRYYGTGDMGNDSHASSVLQIRCRGRGQAPDPAAANEFCWALVDFGLYLKEADLKRWVVVHCTHGYNRTGRWFCYVSTHRAAWPYALVRLLNMTVTEAVKRFAQHRSPGIYKRHYLESLYSYYHEKIPSGTKFPATPSWKPADDGSPEHEPSLPGCAACVAEAAMPMQHDDVVGEEVGPSEADAVRGVAMSAVWGPAAEGRPVAFPGSQPVSLAAANMGLLAKHRYWATWKADGTRYMLLLAATGTYLIDRSFGVRRVQMRWPSAVGELSEKLGYSPTNRQDRTLLDGEMIVDEDKKSGKQQRRYLVYDMIMLEGEVLIRRPFKERWLLIEDRVLKPRGREPPRFRLLPHPPHALQDEPFSVRRKDFWPLHKSRYILDKFIPSLSHESDGLILQPWDGDDSDYQGGTCDVLLKWKFAHLNSVDFLLEMDPSQKGIALLSSRLTAGARVLSFSDLDVARRHHGTIIECTWLPDMGCWEYLRTRTDKDTPNAWRVYEKVWQSIQDDISNEKLLAHVQTVMAGNE